MLWDRSILRLQALLEHARHSNLYIIARGGMGSVDLQKPTCDDGMTGRIGTGWIGHGRGSIYIILTVEMDRSYNNVLTEPPRYQLTTLSLLGTCNSQWSIRQATCKEMRKIGDTKHANQKYGGEAPSFGTPPIRNEKSLSIHVT